MKLPYLIMIIALALVLNSPVVADDELRELIRHRLEHMLPEQPPVAAGQSLFAAPALQALYVDRAWLPIWFDGQGQVRPLLDQVADALAMADEHGLDGDHYHRAQLAELLDAAHDADPATRIDLELLATDALMTLGHHLAFGKVDPESIDPGWLIEREPPELMARLNRRASGNVQLRDILESLLPQHEEYRALVTRLALQRRLLDEADWQLIESGPTLRPGDDDPRVVQIRQRLLALGDLEQNQRGESAIYDEDLEPAIQRFQRRHGLNPDGIVGRNTLAALNVSPQGRIEQLRANLERWRWLPASLGEEYILVNIAGFDMHVVSGGERVMEQRVVVGQPYRRTPVFTGRMTYLVLNPSWEVPHRLASQDQLPRIQEDPSYLDEMGFAVLRGWGSDEVRIDPAEVDWSTLSRRNFPFRLRQAPGPQNALGQVKFMFPNRHNVYLHDSPARGLYALEDRARSSGCIRLEQPERLTAWLLSERASLMSPERIAGIIESGRETTVRLDRPLAVHLLYWTAWVDQHGQVQYRRDIYQRDGALLDALDAAPFRSDPT